MSALDDGRDVLDLDLSDYWQPTDLDAAWALVLDHARQEEAPESHAVDAGEPRTTNEPTGANPEQPDFATMDDHAVEVWIQAGMTKSERARREDEYKTWRRSSGRQVSSTYWLANTVTPEAWDDSTPPTPPTVCRIDGTVGALFASGRISRLFGSSGSAKSWIAKLGTQEQLAAGGCVLYLDGDGVWQDFREHMKAMGLSRDDALSGRLHYSRMEGSLLGDDLRMLFDSQPWSLVVFDGLNRAMSASGLKGNEDPDVNAFFEKVLDPAASTSAAVVVVDHMKKDGETDHGSVFKRNNLTGTDDAVKRMSLIAPGVKGYSTLTLTPKDRPGWATSLHARRSRSQDQPFAHVVVDSTGDSGVPTVVTVQLDAPLDVLAAAAVSQANSDADTLRALLGDNPGGFASNARVRAELKLRRKDMDNNRINAAAVILVASGEVTRTRTGQSLDLRPAANRSQP